VPKEINNIEDIFDACFQNNIRKVKEYLKKPNASGSSPSLRELP